MTAPHTSPAPPDIVGVGALALGMGSLVLGITQIRNWGLADARTIGATVVALAAVTIVVSRSRRHPDPVLYLPLFRDRSFRQGVILNAVIAGTFAGTFFSFIQLLTDGWGLSVFQAGVAVALVPLLGGPLSIVAGRIADRRGPRIVIVTGGLLISLAGLVLSLGVSEHRDIVRLWIPVATIYGVGVGLAHAACNSSALRNVSVERLGMGGAMSRLAMDLGGVITVAAAVALVASAGDTIAGVRHVSLLVSGACAIGALYATRLAPNPPRHD